MLAKAAPTSFEVLYFGRVSIKRRESFSFIRSANQRLRILHEKKFFVGGDCINLCAADPYGSRQHRIGSNDCFFDRGAEHDFATAMCNAGPWPSGSDSTETRCQRWVICDRPSQFCVLVSARFTLKADMFQTSCVAPAAIKCGSGRRQIPIASAAPPRLTHRGFLPWRLSDAGRPSKPQRPRAAGIRNPSQQRTWASYRPKSAFRGKLASTWIIRKCECDRGSRARLTAFKFMRE